MSTDSPRSPHPIDKHVGKRLRMRRSMLGMSQEELANGVNLTFQQIQKYESGSNRVSASRLAQFSKILDVPVDYFFPEYSENKKIRVREASDNDQAEFFDDKHLYSKETFQLLKEYYSLKNEKKRKDLLKLIKGMIESMKEE